MKTFASGDGADAIKNLKDTAANMADFGHESAYQVDYMNRMIIAQVVQFLVEWAITLILAIFNPIEALVEQSFLRALYRVIMRSTILRVIALIAEHMALNIGLGAAMDVLVRWSLANDGERTSHGGISCGRRWGSVRCRGRCHRSSRSWAGRSQKRSAAVSAATPRRTCSRTSAGT